MWHDPDPDVADVEGTVDFETDSAFLFNDGIRRVWLAKSQCQWDEDESVMTLPEWLALDKELI